MPLSARRLLALAALAGAGGVASAQAVAATGGAKAPAPANARSDAAASAKAAAGKRRAKAKAKARARAVKLSGDVAWAPASVLLASRAPLTGAAGGGAAGGGTGAAGTSGGATNGTGGGTPGAGGTTTPPDTPAQQQALGVTVDERNAYTMVLSRTTLTAGSAVIQLNNLGEDPHNLRIVRTAPAPGAPTDFPDTVKGSPTARTLTLAAGTYYLDCTLQQPVSHEQAGMHATLRVDP